MISASNQSQNPTEWKLDDLPNEVLSHILSYELEQKTEADLDDGLTVANNLIPIQSITCSNIMLCSKRFRAIVESEWNNWYGTPREQFVLLQQSRHHLKQLESAHSGFHQNIGWIFKRRSPIVVSIRYLGLLLTGLLLVDFRLGLQVCFLPFLLYLTSFLSFILVEYWFFVNRIANAESISTKINSSNLDCSMNYLSIICYNFTFVTLFYGNVYSKLFSKEYPLFFTYEKECCLLALIPIMITLIHITIRIIIFKKRRLYPRIAEVCSVVIPLFAFYVSAVSEVGTTIAFSCLAFTSISLTLYVAFNPMATVEKIVSWSCIISFCLVCYFNFFLVQYAEIGIAVVLFLFRCSAIYYNQVFAQGCDCKNCQYNSFQ